MSVETKSLIYAKLDMIRNQIRYSINSSFSTTLLNPKDIPIIINNYNRLSFLTLLINSLEKRGYKNIYIIDNNSAYPPLLSYYQNCPYPIFYLKRNIGYTALWDSEIFDKFKHSYYVYTDSDMQLDDSCPDDFMEYFLQIMQKYPFAQKVGFGIRIDDLPDYYDNKKQVILHESQFWKNEVSQHVYKAMIDTTFALYRPYCGGPSSPYQNTYRTGKPYIIKHLPWYVNSSQLGEEEKFYLQSINKPTHWSAATKKE